MIDGCHRAVRSCLKSLVTFTLLGCAVAGEIRGQVPDFAKQVVPLLTKAGCNTGACHGAAAGRGYLQLSLFGGRPAVDYETLVHAPGRRLIDLEQAHQSLLLQKPAALLAHAGGERLAVNTADYSLLEQWLNFGAMRGSMARLVDIELQSANLNTNSEVVTPVGALIPLAAAAKWSDGTSTVVSQWLVIEGASPAGDRDASVTVVWNNGIPTLTGKRVGLWTITVRIAALARSLQIVCHPPDQSLPIESTQQTDSAIDALVHHANQRLGLLIAGPAKPHWIARRMWLDLLGRQPTPGEWTAATDQIAVGDNAKLVDRLLASEEFAERAADQIMHWMGSSAKTKPTLPDLRSAIARRLGEDDRMLEMLRDMLVPRPQIEGLIDFQRSANDARTRAELIGSTWLGVRLGCAQCHDHPFDHWTQDDYFAITACWAEIESSGAVRRIAGRTTTDLRTGLPALARLPNGESIQVGEPPDTAFSRWLCDPNNDLIAKNLANRLWQWLLGRGLVVEIDDHRQTNPPSNRALLQHLVARLRIHDFRLKPLLREILLSDTYARDSTMAGDAETELRIKLLGIRAPKRIDFPMFETLARQAIAPTTLARSRTSSAPISTSMLKQISEEPQSCSRTENCSDPFSASLNRVAGPAINAIVGDPLNAVHSALAAGKPIDQTLSETYFRLFGEPPSDETISHWQRLMQSHRDNAAVTDLVWSWLVSDAFLLTQ